MYLIPGQAVYKEIWCIWGKQIGWGELQPNFLIAFQLTLSWNTEQHFSYVLHSSITSFRCSKIMTLKLLIFDIVFCLLPIFEPLKFRSVRIRYVLLFKRTRFLTWSPDIRSSNSVALSLLGLQKWHGAGVQGRSCAEVSTSAIVHTWSNCAGWILGTNTTTNWWSSIHSYIIQSTWFPAIPKIVSRCILTIATTSLPWPNFQTYWEPYKSGNMTSWARSGPWAEDGEPLL